MVHHITTTDRNATYFAFHIRRGDFQYNEALISANEIWKNTKHLLDPNITNIIYISTDEPDRNWFLPFIQSGDYEVRFLSDYLPASHKLLGKKLNMNHIGMMEQVTYYYYYCFVIIRNYF